jgi:hypothetical protein
LAPAYAKYLTLLLSCVTSSTKTFLPKFGLANRNFALQHWIRDKARGQKPWDYRWQSGKKGKFIMLLSQILEWTCVSGACPQDMNRTTSVALQHNMGPRKKS